MYLSDMFSSLNNPDIARENVGKIFEDYLQIVGAHVQWGRNFMLLSLKTTQLPSIIY
jgi:hypothetical protein